MHKDKVLRYLLMGAVFTFSSVAWGQVPAETGPPAGTEPAAGMPAPAPTPAPSRVPPVLQGGRGMGLQMPFSRGRWNIGGGISGGGSGGSLLGQASLNIGYFIVNKAEVGVSTSLQFGAGSRLLAVLPYFRYILFQSPLLSPYVRVFGGRYFVKDVPDPYVVGGAIGTYYSLQGNVYLSGEVNYRIMLPEENCFGNCHQYGLAGGIGMMF